MNKQKKTVFKRYCKRCEELYESKMKRSRICLKCDKRDINKKKLQTMKL